MLRLGKQGEPDRLGEQIVAALHDKGRRVVRIHSRIHAHLAMHAFARMHFGLGLGPVRALGLGLTPACSDACGVYLARCHKGAHLIPVALPGPSPPTLRPAAQRPSAGTRALFACQP